MQQDSFDTSFKVMNTADCDSRYGKFWCWAGEDSILGLEPSNSDLSLLIPNRAQSHLAPLDNRCRELSAFGIYMASFSAAISLAEFSELLSVIIVSGTSGGFASSCGTSFIAVR